MDMNLSNSIELNQKLTITPQMEQSIKILQMGCQELTQYIEQQSLDNPLLDVEPNYTELERQEKLKKKLDWLNESDEENRIYYNTTRDREDYEYPVISKAEDSLSYHLLSQLDVLPLSPVDIRVAKYMIESLNENGYLEANLEDICKKFNISNEKGEQLLNIIQSFEPSGVGARNLRECLHIQIMNKGVPAPNLLLIVDDYLEDLAKNKLNVIAKELNVSLEEVKRLRAIIKSLNPFPASTFNTTQPTRYITPDIVVVKFADYYEVLLNDFSYPKININNDYRKILATSTDTQTQKYITQKMDQASWIVKCIEQRNSTLHRVAKAIVDTQKSFFDKGSGYLVPMILKDVADLLGLHESTVSRAVCDKFLQCAWGTFELKYFFSSAVSTTTATDTTAENIKLSIKQLIDNENKKKPYSDQVITNMLKEKGIALSRRTVSKYRDELGIANASRRKEF